MSQQRDRNPRQPGRGGPRGTRGGEGHRSAMRRSAPTPPTQSPRYVALKALQDAVHGEAYAAQALDRWLERVKLRPEDVRLATSVFYFALENRLYIEYMLGKFLSGRPEPVVNDILHIAAAQILFMDRVPDHAIVDEAVKQVRFSGREGLAGLVNGVLRNLIRARDAGELTLPDREAEPEKWLSVKHSLAPVVAERLISAYGIDRAEAIAACRAGSAQTVRFNRMKTDAAGFEAWLDRQGFQWKKGLVAGAYRVENGGKLADSDAYRQGLMSIQGQSAMLAALAVEARPGMQILDACAAPGGKTALMAEAMGGSGRVFAWDVRDHRVALIRAAAHRLGLDNVRPSVYDARLPRADMKLGMDAVLVDAPCSGLGVIADKPDIKYRTTHENLDALPPLQLEILEACAQAVRVGGLLVYATCTILPEENGSVVAKFLAKHPEFVPDEGNVWLPEALVPEYREGMIQLLPDGDGIEGFFIARLRRKGV